MKAGYPRGTAREIRDRRTSVVREDQARRYAERYRAAPPDAGSITSSPSPLPDVDDRNA